MAEAGHPGARAPRASDEGGPSLTRIWDDVIPEEDRKGGVIAGIGAGRFAHEFDAVGYRADAQFGMTDELADIRKRAVERDGGAL